MTAEIYLMWFVRADMEIPFNSLSVAWQHRALHKHEMKESFRRKKIIACDGDGKNIQPEVIVA